MYYLACESYFELYCNSSGDWYILPCTFIGSLNALFSLYKGLQSFWVKRYSQLVDDLCSSTFSCAISLPRLSFSQSNVNTLPAWRDIDSELPYIQGISLGIHFYCSLVRSTFTS
jgi:hypothetical protein